ncbi:MAG: AhpC/TSA family protein [Prevotella sp.]|nr:AhpC/TSA family protein [Prevotella sp.]
MTMNRFIIFVLAVLTLAGCSEKKPTFTVEGSVEGAKDKTLCLFNNALGGAVLIDSVRLDEDGTFRFEAEAPQTPDLYCLNIGNQIIYFGIDSTETVTIRAHYPNMAQRYEVEGSENSEKIRQLALKQQALQQQAIALERNLDLSSSQIADSLQRLVDNYKREVTLDYIFQAPGSIYAYYALFQTLGGYNLFDRQDPKDVRVFAAVATSWDTYYPESDRAKHLHNTAIKGMKDQRQAAALEMRVAETAQKIVTSGLLELELPDVTGRIHTLTELTGKVVLLDFHVFGMKESAARILSLRELYNKYHAQGLEIYQVGMDDNEHFWKQQTDALPWICVYDPSGQSAVRYNVQSLPEFFLIDRSNALYKRSSQMDDVEAEIRNLLK